MKTFRLQADLTFEASDREHACKQLRMLFTALYWQDEPYKDYQFAGELFLKPIDDAYTVGTQLKLEF